MVNLVGGFASDQPVATTPLADFEAQFALNLRPTYLVTQAALPALIEAQERRAAPPVTPPPTTPPPPIQPPASRNMP